MEEHSTPRVSRRSFVQLAAGAGLGVGLAGSALAQDPPRDADGKIVPGFEKKPQETGTAETKSDRKLRVGIAGFGLCHMGAAFGFQNHPNVEVVAVSDLIPHRRAGLAKACRCEKTYPSCEEMIKDDNIDTVFIATDAPSHARLAVAALKHGKHVGSAVPAVYGSLEDADRLFEAVKKTGLKYMMFETSCFHANLYAWHKQYEAGLFGQIVYSEGEYYHNGCAAIAGYNPKTNKVDANGWRRGFPPQWYPTHSNAFYVGVTGGSFTEVSCMGKPSIRRELQPANNDYKNPFGTEIALFRTSEGGMSRMAVSWDMPSAGGEKGRVYGQKNGKGNAKTARPPLPKGVGAGGHGGSHGHLMSEFVDAILKDRKPWIDVAQALNMTVAGIVAHQSALKDGELLTIPEFKL